MIKHSKLIYLLYVFNNVQHILQSYNDKSDAFLTHNVEKTYSLKIEIV